MPKVSMCTAGANANVPFNFRVNSPSFGGGSRDLQFRKSTCSHFLEYILTLQHCNEAEISMFFDDGEEEGTFGQPSGGGYGLSCFCIHDKI